MMIGGNTSIFEIPCSLFDIFFYPGINSYLIIFANLFCYSFFLVKRKNNHSCTATTLFTGT